MIIKIEPPFQPIGKEERPLRLVCSFTSIRHAVADRAVAICPLDPKSPAATQLLALSDTLMHSLYPAERNHLEPAAALKKEGVIFLGASIDGQVTACSAPKEMADDGRYVEIKWVFVVEGMGEVG